MTVSSKIYNFPLDIGEAVFSGELPDGEKASLPLRIAFAILLLPSLVVGGILGSLVKIGELVICCKNKDDFTVTDNKVNNVMNGVLRNSKSNEMSSLPSLPSSNPVSVPLSPIKPVKYPTLKPQAEDIVKYSNPSEDNVKNPSIANPTISSLNKTVSEPLHEAVSELRQRQWTLLKSAQHSLREAIEKTMKSNSDVVLLNTGHKKSFSATLNVAKRVDELFQGQLKILQGNGKSFLNHSYYHSTKEGCIRDILDSEVRQGDSDNRFGKGVYISTNDEHCRRFGEVTLAINDEVISRLCKTPKTNFSSESDPNDVALYFLPGQSDLSSVDNRDRTLWVRLRSEIPAADISYLIVPDGDENLYKLLSEKKPVLFRSEGNLIRNIFSQIVEVERPLPTVGAALNKAGWGRNLRWGVAISEQDRRCYPGITPEDFPAAMRASAKQLANNTISKK